MSEKFYTCNGKTQNLSEWAKELKLHISSLSRRIQKFGAEAALSIPAGEKLTPGTPSRTNYVSWWPELRDSWDEDDRCWYVVQCHPHGLSLEQVGELMGITRERVRQIEERALRKLRNKHSTADIVRALLQQSKEIESRREQCVYPEGFDFGDAWSFQTRVRNAKYRKASRANGMDAGKDAA